MSSSTDLIELNIIPPPRRTFPSAKDLYSTSPVPALSKYIRVLDIDAVDTDTDTHDAPITAHLRVVDLEAATKSQYTALSYVWVLN